MSDTAGADVQFRRPLHASASSHCSMNPLNDAVILRQLTPVHSRMLDWIFENAQEPSLEEPTISAWRDVAADEVSHHFGLNNADYRILASDLHRLQVIDGRRETQTVYGGKGLSSASTYEVVGLTPL